MAATISPVPQYSRMIDEQGVEMHPEHAGHVGDSELTPLNHNPLAQQSLAQLQQRFSVNDAEQGDASV